MPFNRIPHLSSALVTRNYPFQLLSSSVKQDGSVPAKNDLDCQCPCGVLTNPNITSSKLFADILTTDQKRAKAAASSNLNVAAKKAITVYKESYLFRGLFPSARQTTTAEQLSDYGTHNTDPVLRIYGLDQPIIIEDFFSGDQDTRTLKFWLTVCFPSGETNGQSAFQTCAQKVKNDDKNNLSCDARSLRPQVAFISYGLTYPTTLVVTKTVDKSVPNVTPPAPRFERRQIEAHLPIGEVNVAGKVVQQFVVQNLVLMDLCFNGSPAKYPMPIFS